jgi:hypothetical protein
VPQEKAKTLRYRRAIYTVPKDDEEADKILTLEEYLKLAHAKFKSIEQRRVRYDSGYTLEARDARSRRQVGTLLHIAAYTDGEPATIVPLVAGTDSAPVDVLPPPKNTDFMDGDVMALISGNDVVLCASQIHDINLYRYCAGIFTAADLPVQATLFRLERAADADRVQLLEDEGVKQIRLSVSTFDATLSHAKRKSVRTKLGAGMMEELFALLGKDVNMEEAKDYSSLSAEIVIKFDKRRKNGELGGERIEALAKQVVADDDDEGFTIVTGEDNVVGASTLSLHKSVSLPAYGKSVSRDAAYQELVTYFKELDDDGLLEQ